ncbi:hypothetical protein [Microvirga lenta]|nr:hypothetical protein [Microvirga lenta]
MKTLLSLRIARAFVLSLLPAAEPQPLRIPEEDDPLLPLGGLWR